MIYFLQPLSGGPVKIGTTTDIDRRRRQLESAYGQPLAVLGVISGGRQEEQGIHERFSHLRLGRTEQFQPAADLMEFIGRPLLAAMNPETVEAIPKSEDGALVALKCRKEYKEWVESLAKKYRTTVAHVLDMALVAFARSKGLEDPPER